MRHANYLRLLFLTATLSIGTFSTAHASGAKMPTASDGSVITDTSSSSTPTTPTSGTPELASGSGSTSGSSGSGSGAVTTPPVKTPPVTTPPVATTPPPISDKYSFLDPGHIVPKTLLAKTLAYFDSNSSKIKNKNVIGVIDFKQHNSKERFYIIDMNTGVVETYLVAHGKNSDPDYDGYATQFSNDSGSLMSSQGFYLAAETYDGSHGYSLKLDGLSSTNSNARSREIVIHPADYVAPGGKIGRSWGCPAVEPRYSVQVINKLKGGSLLYAE